jgi:hypothetical protein
MDSLEQLVADIMADEQNASYTEQGIKPLFTVPKMLVSILLAKLQVFERKNRDFIGMTRVGIIYENG